MFKNSKKSSVNRGRRYGNGNYSANFDANIARTRGKKKNYSKRRTHNPGEAIERAEEISEMWHGRDIEEYVDVVEEMNYDSAGAILGKLEELEILCSDNCEEGVPLNWEEQNEEKKPWLVCDPRGKQLMVIGGDQYLSDADLVAMGLSEVDIDRTMICVGEINAIAYFADKHHLEGPKYQSKGTVYMHEAGEEGGLLPYLVYDRRNRKMFIVGGSYTITEEGLRD